MNLIPQWTQLWKMYSVQIAAILVALNAAATYWPSLQGVVSPGVFATVNSLLGMAVILGRIIKQDPQAA
jgi:hypothetical protein